MRYTLKISEASAYSLTISFHIFFCSLEYIKTLNIIRSPIFCHVWYKVFLNVIISMFFLNILFTICSLHIDFIHWLINLNRISSKLILTLESRLKIFSIIQYLFKRHLVASFLTMYKSIFWNLINFFSLMLRKTMDVHAVFSKYCTV